MAVIVPEFFLSSEEDSDCKRRKSLRTDCLEKLYGLL